MSQWLFKVYSSPLPNDVDSIRKFFAWSTSTAKAIIIICTRNNSDDGQYPKIATATCLRWNIKQDETRDMMQDRKAQIGRQRQSNTYMANTFSIEYQQLHYSNSCILFLYVLLLLLLLLLLSSLFSCFFFVFYSEFPLVRFASGNVSLDLQKRPQAMNGNERKKEYSTIE